MSKRISYEEISSWAKDVQFGYQIVPDKGGKPSQLFWNNFSGLQQILGSSMPNVWQTLVPEQERLAEDLVALRQ